MRTKTARFARACIWLLNAPRIVSTPLAVNWSLNRLKALYEPKNALVCRPSSAVALPLLQNAPVRFSAWGDCFVHPLTYRNGTLA